MSTVLSVNVQFSLAMSFSAVRLRFAAFSAVRSGSVISVADAVRLPPLTVAVVA